MLLLFRLLVQHGLRLRKCSIDIAWAHVKKKISRNEMCANRTREIERKSTYSKVGNYAVAIYMRDVVLPFGSVNLFCPSLFRFLSCLFHRCCIHGRLSLPQRLVLPFAFRRQKQSWLRRKSVVCAFDGFMPFFMYVKKHIKTYGIKVCV